MRKKPRGGTRLVELAIFAVLLIAVLLVLGVVTGVTKISALYAPATQAPAPASLAGLLPTPAPTVTRTPQSQPTALVTPTPAAQLGQSGQVLLMSHLRNEPRLADVTQQAILCPNDAVAFLAQRTVEDVVWYRVRVTQRADDCNANHAALGVEGWASSNVISPPAGPVAASAP